MRRLQGGVLASVVLAGMAVSTALADDAPPKIVNLQVKPHRVCRQVSDTCQHPGGDVSFKVTEFSQVVAATRPLGTGRGPVVIFKLKFGPGKHTKHFSVRGLPTGKYDMQLTAVDPSNNRSHPADRTYRILK